GLQKGHLFIIGARPRVGKTTLAIQIMKNFLFQNNVPLAFFSLEMTAREISFKFLSLLSQIPYKSILNGEIEAEDYQKIVCVAKELEKKPLIIDDSSGISIE